MTKKKARKWREFELFVSRIEKALAPLGATVASPDRIPDKVTGQLREVDASVRYKVGTVPMLVTIECRDRTGIQDVQWIEQLAAKKASIGASATVAVASSGFTAPAIKKAEASGIELRTLAKATAQDFVDWLGCQTVVLEVSEWNLASLALELYDAPDDAELAADVQASFAQQGSLAPIFVRSSDRKRFHIENMLTEWDKGNGTFFPQDLPVDGTKVRLTLHQPLDRDCLHVETTQGEFDIRIIHIGLVLSRTRRKVPMAQAAKYLDPNATLVHAAEWELEPNIRLSLYRDLDSGETKIGLSSDEVRRT